MFLLINLYAKIYSPGIAIKKKALVNFHNISHNGNEKGWRWNLGWILPQLYPKTIYQELGDFLLNRT